jgi:hypothetical protein
MRIWHLLRIKRRLSSEGLHAHIQSLKTVLSSGCKIVCGIEEVRFLEESLQCEIVLQVHSVVGVVLLFLLGCRVVRVGARFL